MADKSAICMSEGGPGRSPFLTAAQVKDCISQGLPPRISTLALLQLARWCQERPSPEQGGDPCLAAAVTAFSPACTDECPEVDLPRSTLATAGASSAATTLPTAQPADRSTSASTGTEGGVA